MEWQCRGRGGAIDRKQNKTKQNISMRVILPRTTEGINVESQQATTGFYVNIKLTSNHHARSVYNYHSARARTVLGHSSWIP